MKKSISTIILYTAVMIILTPVYSTAMTQDNAIQAVSNFLVKQQWKDGSYFDGCWVGSNQYTGSIVAGLINAYEITGNIAYKDSAERGAMFILREAAGNFYGDEAYALTRLGQVLQQQDYIDIVLNFYDGLDTSQYISGFNLTTAEKAAFYVSFHAVASYMVGAKDADIWREAIINFLSRVDDDLSYFPVMTLGVSAWALAQTGPMDETLIDPFGSVGVDYWQGIALEDLPDMLAGHQVTEGEYAGSFYVRFDHTSPGNGYYASGYTEDTVYGTLGLIAAYQAGQIDSEAANDNVKWDFSEQIENARNTMASAVPEKGIILEHLWDGHAFFYLFGGEMLEVFDSSALEQE